MFCQIVSHIALCGSHLEGLTSQRHKLASFLHLKQTKLTWLMYIALCVTKFMNIQKERKLKPQDFREKTYSVYESTFLVEQFQEIDLKKSVCQRSTIAHGCFHQSLGTFWEKRRKELTPQKRHFLVFESHFGEHLNKKIDQNLSVSKVLKETSLFNFPTRWLPAVFTVMCL